MFRFLLLFAIGTVSSLAAADISGKWTGTLETSGKQLPMFLALEQHGQELLGKFARGDEDLLPIDSGEIVGNQVTFLVHEDSGRVLKFRLTVADHLLSGEMREGDQVSKVSLPMSSNPQGGGRSSAPILTNKTEPQYTDEARSAKLQGTVMLQVQIDETGKVSEHITVLRSLGSGLDEKAMEAVRQWRFKPALRDGKPVAVPATIEVNFRL